MPALDYQGLHAIVDRLDTPLGHFRLGLDGNAFEGPYWLQFVLNAPDAQGDEPEVAIGQRGCTLGPAYCRCVSEHILCPNWSTALNAAKLREWHGRKWRVSAHMTTREVLGTALAAVIAAMEHEVREGFKYMGQAVFGPHIPLASLMEGAKAEPDARKREATPMPQGFGVSVSPPKWSGDRQGPIPQGSCTYKGGPCMCGEQAVCGWYKHPVEEAKPCSCAPGVCVERLGGILAGTTFCASRNGQH